jgi:hypothetical protein
MVQPFAPLDLAGRWWAPLLAATGLLVCLPAGGLAQATKGTPPAAKGADPKAAPAPKAAPKGAAAKKAAAPAAPKAEAGAEEAPPAAEPARPKQAELEERYEDPRAQEALTAEFPALYPNLRRIDADADRRIAAMAEGSANADAAFIQTYVQYQLAQLTAKPNVGAMLDPAGNPQAAKAIEVAGANLLNPLLIALDPARPNPAFRATYTRALVAAAGDALKNNLYARTMLMVALSRSRDPQAFRVFRQVLDDPQQPLTLKILAAVGVTQAADDGRAGVDPGEAVQLGRSLAGFLERELEAFWPSRYRAVEALGALRQASANLNEPKATLAASLLAVLADPQARPQVRAEAAWALGMLRPNVQNPRYNFELIAHHMGGAAADIGDVIVAEGTANPVFATRLADQLLVLLSGIEGDPQIRNAGLLRVDHPNVANQRAAIQGVLDRVREVARAAVELSRSAGVQRAQRTAEVAAAVQALRAHLAKSPPADLALFPDGPTFPLAPPAGAAAENADAAPAPPASPTAAAAPKSR